MEADRSRITPIICPHIHSIHRQNKLCKRVFFVNTKFSLIHGFGEEVEFIQRSVHINNIVEEVDKRNDFGERNSITRELGVGENRHRSRVQFQRLISNKLSFRAKLRVSHQLPKPQREIRTITTITTTTTMANDSMVRL